MKIIVVIGWISFGDAIRHVSFLKTTLVLQRIVLSILVHSSASIDQRRQKFSHQNLNVNASLVNFRTILSQKPPGSSPLRPHVTVPLLVSHSERLPTAGSTNGCRFAMSLCITLFCGH